MLKQLSFFLLLLSNLFSSTFADWVNIPDTIYLHQIFPVTIKYLNVANEDVSLKITPNESIKVVYIDNNTSRDDFYTFKRIYFKVLQTKAVLPSISLHTSSYNALIPSIELNVKKLNPPDDFSQLLAKDLKILQTKSVQFNEEKNIIVLQIKGELANLEDFNLTNIKKQNIKELNFDFPYTTIIYYAIIPSTIHKLQFSYFNPLQREYKKINIPIEILDQRVSTQSQINPIEDKNLYIKITLFFSIGFLFLLIAYSYKSFFSLLIAFLLIGYGGYRMIPLKKVCIKPNSDLYILPTKNSTIFQTIHTKIVTPKLNEINNYTKVKIKNKIGWVKNEDLCKN